MMVGVSQPIGVGIVGLSANGGWAALAHVPALRALSQQYEIRALTASTNEAAALAAAKFGVPFHTADPAEMVKRPDVDLVVVTVKVPFHRELVELALAAGKAVYCEWPLGNGLREAEMLTDLADKRQLRAFIGLQARAVPAIRYVKELVETGYVGKVSSTSMLASNGSPWNGLSSTRRVYLADVRNGATMLTIPFGHSIDALTWTLGKFRSVAATLTVHRPQVFVQDQGISIHTEAADQL